LDDLVVCHYHEGSMTWHDWLVVQVFTIRPRISNIRLNSAGTSRIKLCIRNQNKVSTDKCRVSGWWLFSVTHRLTLNIHTAQLSRHGPISHPQR